MNTKIKALKISIVFSLIFYIADSLIDSLMTYKNLTFLEVLITNPPYQELYTRLLGICLIIILGLLLPTIIGKRPLNEQINHKSKKITSDPYLMMSVSNQLRTPLNAIQGFVELLKEPTSETSKRLYVNHIKTSGNYMLELINNVADITLIESGNLYLKEEDCKINILLKQVHTKFISKLKEKNKSGLNFTLNTANNDDNYSIRIDPNRIRQVFENLLENSIAFTNEGHIEFGYKNMGEDKLEFFIYDSGTSLSEDRLDMIDMQFNSVIDNRMTPFDIVSLRINLSKHLVKIMGGKLAAESSLNQGNRFSFQLKKDVIQQAKEVIIVPETPKPEQKKVKPLPEEDRKKWAKNTILIAEDVETNFIYLREILSDTAINIIWAQNGKIACEHALNNPDIDIILMDILMPEMDGIEAARIIKKELPELPIIAQTAYHLDEKEYDDAIKYFAKYLIKPIWSNDLLTALNEYL